MLTRIIRLIKGLLTCLISGGPRIGLMGFMGYTFLFWYNSIKEIRITNFEKKKIREHTFLPKFDFPINQGFKYLENKIFRDILSFL